MKADTKQASAIERKVISMAKELENKQKFQESEEEQELNLDDLEQVAGGANPFANYARVPNQDYDASIKRKV